MTIDEPVQGVATGDLLRAAADLVVLDQFGSLPRLQRRLAISHSRAWAVMEALEANGVVGPELNGVSRYVLATPDQLPEVLARLGVDDSEPGP